MGRYALNTFDIDTDADPPARDRFYGLFEYIPGAQGVNENERPLQFLTAHNYPNPFNPSTTISFTLTEPEFVNVSLYNVNGQKVRSLVFDRFPAGKNSVLWNSLSDDGRLCASGIYLYRIKAGRAFTTGKMLLVR